MFEFMLIMIFILSVGYLIVEKNKGLRVEKELEEANERFQKLNDNMKEYVSVQNSAMKLKIKMIEEIKDHLEKINRRSLDNQDQIDKIKSIVRSK